jgi:hypothetical protein
MKKKRIKEILKEKKEKEKGLLRQQKENQKIYYQIKYLIKIKRIKSYFLLL